MKKTILYLSLGSLLTLGAAMAQDQSAPPAAQDGQAEHGGGYQHADPDKQLAFLTKKLNLSADQQQQIRPILVDRNTQIQAVRADTSLSKQDRFAKMRAIREDSRSKIEAVLNNDQKQTFEQMRPEHGRHQRQSS